MRHYFLRKKNSPCLLLLFSGWATDERLYANFHLPDDCDICVVSDYVDSYLDLDGFRSYRSIRLLAWSLGVFMADAVLRGEQLPLVSAVALNGTISPVHDEMGIPKDIYEGTSGNLSEASLSKFYRRMCGDADSLDLLLSSRPDLSVARLRLALDFVEKLAAESPFLSSGSVFKKVVVGTKDRIFPPSNMIRAWQGFSELLLIDVPHFDSNLMENLMYGE